MRRRERHMALGMPILRQDDILELLSHLVDDRNDFVPVCRRKSAPGAEVILHVDDDKNIGIGQLHDAPFPLQHVCVQTISGPDIPVKRAGPGGGGLEFGRGGLRIERFRAASPRGCPDA